MKQRNFKEIYDVICSSFGAELEKKRKETIRKYIILYLVVILFFVIILLIGVWREIALVITMLLISLVVIFFGQLIISYSYKKAFKEKIINKIVQICNPNFEYSYFKGISSVDYAESRFDKNWDVYSSRDLVIGRLEDGSTVQMASINVQDKYETRNSKGDRVNKYVTIFCGLYGVIKLNTLTTSDFMIVNNSQFSKFNKDRIEMESAEFEKYYDVYAGSDDFKRKQNAMEILGPNVIEDFIKIRNLLGKSINVRVCKNAIYFRIPMNEIFEVPVFRNTLDFNVLQRNFLIIDLPRMLYEAFIDNILLMYGNKEDKEKRNLLKNIEEN